MTRIDKTLQADLSLIRDYTLADASVARPVSVTHFHKGAKHLYYVNARHASGADNPTSQTIKAAVAQYKPRCIIIEWDIGGKISPPEIVEYVTQQAQNNFLHASEPAFAAHLAIENSIPFIGGEPDNRTVFKKMQEAGYDTKDVMNFYLLRQIPAWKRECLLNEANFSEQAEKYLRRLGNKADVPDGQRPSFNEFTSWYNQHNTTKKNFLQIEGNDLAPFNVPGANFFNELAHITGIIREQHIDVIIADALNEFDTVLVVYGDAHLVQSTAVFENMLSVGENIRFYCGAGVNSACAVAPTVRREDITPSRYAQMTKLQN